MAKAKIKYALKSSLDEDEFDPKYEKVLISLRLDGSVLDAIKAEAQKRDMKYQPLIHQVLKDYFLGNSEEERIRKIVRDEMKKTG